MIFGKYHIQPMQIAAAIAAMIAAMAEQYMQLMLNG